MSASTPHSQPFDKDSAALLSAYVDESLHDQERTDVEHWLETDSVARRAFEAERRFKRFIHERCPRAKAPQSLYANIDGLLTDLAQETIKPVRFFSDRIYWAAAAIVLLSSFFSVYNRILVPDTFDVESHAWRHFTSGMAEANVVDLTEASTALAKAVIFEKMGMDVTVPELNGASFVGVHDVDFVDGYHTPVLTYAAANAADLIHIFVFKVDRMNDGISLQRDPDAVATCSNNPHAVHVADIKGKHVVSWQWQDTWYTAVSNHSGDVIAAMLPR
jgi:hypothetical protein